MRKTLLVLSVLLVFVSAAWAAPLQSFAPGSFADFQPGVRWKDNAVVAVGTGAPPAYAAHPAQAESLARRAAVVDGYRNLAERICGVQVDAYTSLENSVIKNDTSETRVSGLIKDAQIVQERRLDNGGYQVLVAIPLYGDGSVAAIALDPAAPKVPLPAPRQLPAVRGNYSGLVVDAAGLGLERCMSPVIYDEGGRAIYGVANLDTSFVTRYGMADYEESVGIQTRAGVMPLVVKAVALRDFSRNLVVSVADADKILAENQSNRFLEGCKVVFVQ